MAVIIERRRRSSDDPGEHVFLGKTTLARIIAQMTGSVIKELSATSSGSADVRAVFEEAKNLLQLSGRRTVLFLGNHTSRFQKTGN